MRMLSRIVLLLSVLSGSAAAASSTTILGHALPVDAVPYAEQVLRVPCDNTRNENTFDHPVSVYQRYGCVQDLFSDTLVDLDPGFQPEPAGATSWSVDTEAPPEAAAAVDRLIDGEQGHPATKQNHGSTVGAKDMQPQSEFMCVKASVVWAQSRTLWDPTSHPSVKHSRFGPGSSGRVGEG